MPPLRECFEGLWLGGAYLLRQCIEESADSAYFLAEADESGRAIVRLDRAGDEASARCLIWERIAANPHPNVMRIFKVGEVEADGIRAVWVAMEHPEENLGDVLRSRALSAEEARAALSAAADGLAHLHAHGMVLGEMNPWHVVAAGDAVKVPADGARETGASTPDGDVRALGLTACEMLTRRMPEMVDGAPRFTPEEAGAIAPLEKFIRKCLEGRWTAARLAAYLRNPDAEIEDESLAAAPVEPAPQPRVPERRPMPPPAAPVRPTAREPHRGAGSGRAPWRYAAAVLCALALILIAMALGRKQEAAAPAPPPAVPVARPGPAPVDAEAAAPAPSPTARWRVVAYTYGGQEAAQKRARIINEKFPLFRAEVFVPRGSGPPYLVTLGGRMTQQEAERLQRTARRKGLPRDTYVRNYRN